MGTTVSKANRIPWEDMYHLLELFVAEYNRLPKRTERYCGVQLGEWCSNQKRRVPASGNAERLQKLREIGLLDADAGYANWHWEQNYQLLCAFIAEHHRMPQVLEEYRGVNLGSWYAAQKAMLQNEQYAPERRVKIEALGIRKAAGKETWEQHYGELVEFVSIYHRLPKQKEVYRGFRLGLWCARQIQQAKLDRYDAERRQKLIEIGLLK